MEIARAQIARDRRNRTRRANIHPHPGRLDAGTFIGFDGTTSGEKIDGALVSVEREAQQAEIIRAAENLSYLSDRFPVVATLTLTASPPRTPTP